MDVYKFLNFDTVKLNFKIISSNTRWNYKSSLPRFSIH